MTAMDVSEPGLEELLEYLRDSRGFDFTGYKRPTLTRRIAKRMDITGTDTYAAYLDHLEVHPDEFPLLFDALLINVTAFFRDPAAWDALRTRVVPEMLSRLNEHEPIRVWSAGCATGEEAISAAIVLVEALGVEAFKHRVKVFATDVDDDALMRARRAEYPEKATEAMDASVRDRYFTRSDAGFLFDRDLRRSVIFGRHDLVQDAPISKVDLILSRNTLMYFNADIQAGVLEKFHYSLQDEGHLFLGKAETLLARHPLFEPLDMKHRIFSKVASPSRWTIKQRLGMPSSREGQTAPEDTAPAEPTLHEASAQAAPVAQILIDGAGHLAEANDQAMLEFDVGSADLGRPLQDLHLSYRPLELRSRMDRAVEEHSIITESDIAHVLPDGRTRRFEVTFTPLFEDSRLLGVIITFVDVTAAFDLQEVLKRTEQELETIHEELETTNEELQSTVEELETTNEELQSTNEELETTNEELMSTNTEIISTNDELQRHAEDARRAEASVRSIISSLEVALVVVDLSGRVMSWSEQARNLWGLRDDEAVGEQLFGLDFGLSISAIETPVRRAIAGEHSATTVAAVDRLGRDVSVRIDCHPLTDHGETLGAVIVMEAQPS